MSSEPLVNPTNSVVPYTTLESGSSIGQTLQWTGTNWSTSLQALINYPPIQLNDSAPVVPTPSDTYFGFLYKKEFQNDLFWSTQGGGEVLLSVKETWNYVVSQNINMNNFSLTNLSSGSALTPSLSFYTSPSTGIYSGITGEIDFTNSGTQTFSLLSNGILRATTSGYENLLSSPNDIPNKKYVDNLSSGLVIKQPCRAKTVVALPSYTASGSGVGKTISGSAVGALPSIDTVSLVVGDRLLVDNNGTIAGQDTGIYVVTSLGSVSSSWVLTRSTDFDTSALVLPGSEVFILEGGSRGKGYVMITDGTITIDVTPLVWILFIGQGDNLGDHIATQNINMNNYSIINLEPGNIINPSLSFNSGPTTGIYSGTPSQLNFVTNGVNTFTIDSTGLMFADITGYTAQVAADLTGQSIPNKQYVTNAQGLSIDSIFRVRNTTDTTKVFALDCSNVLTGTTRTAIVPNFNMIFPATYLTASLLVGAPIYPLTTGDNNTLVGISAGTSITSGSNNVAIGSSSLSTLTNNSNNTSVGYGALNVSTAPDNTAFGYAALTANTTGTRNTVVGKNSAIKNTTGSDVIVVGTNSLGSNLIGSNNIVIGNSVLGASIASYNLSIGNSTLNANIVGTQNTVIGHSAASTGTTGNYLVAVGYQAMKVNTADGNVAIGNNSLLANTSGSNNVAVGYGTLAANVSSNNLTAVGYNALTASTGSDNTAVGNFALSSTLAGSQNTSVGSNSLRSNVGGGQNTAMGYNALVTTVFATACTAVGANALANNTASYNAAFGASALNSNTLGTGNTAVGYNASSSTTTGINNTALGYSALSGNILGGGNIAIGVNASSTCNTSNTIAIGNDALMNNNCPDIIAIGSSALAANTAGAYNIGIGSSALSSIINGNRNIALGYQSLKNLTGNNNIGIGYQTLISNLTGPDNIAIGVSALSSNLSNSNIAIGTNSQTVNTSGSNNLSLGISSLSSNTGGSNNVSIGNNTFAAGLSLSNNTAVGYYAGNALTTGSETAIGYYALAANTTGAANTAIGTSALSKLIGDSNVAIGDSAGSLLTSGNYNIFIGAGVQVDSKLTSGSNRIVIGTGGVGIADNSLIIAGSTAITGFYFPGLSGGITTNVLYFNTSTGQITRGINTVPSGPGALIDTAGRPAPALSQTMIGTGALANIGYAGVHSVANTAIGAMAFNALSDGSTVSCNTAVGANAGSLLTAGMNNTFIGYGTGQNLPGGTYGTNANVLVGSFTAGLCTATTFQSNTFIGDSVCANLGSTTTTNNVCVGAGAGANINNISSSILIGAASCAFPIGMINSVVVGYQAYSAYNINLVGLVTGTNVIAIGYQAMIKANSVSDCIGIGNACLGTVSGNQNIAIGSNAGSVLTTGTGNIFFGYNSDIKTITGSNNIIIGNNTLADATSTASNNRIVIGTGGVGIADNSLTIAGSTAITGFYFPGLSGGITTNVLYFNTSTGQVTYGAAPAISSSFSTTLQVTTNTDTLLSYQATVSKGGTKIDAYGNIKFVDDGTSGVHTWGVITSGGTTSFQVYNNTSVGGTRVATSNNTLDNGTGQSTFAGAMSVTSRAAGSVASFLTGSSTYNGDFQIGRTTGEGRFAIAASGGQYTTNTIAGDIIMRCDNVGGTNTQSLHLTAGTANSAIQILSNDPSGAKVYMKTLTAGSGTPIVIDGSQRLWSANVIQVPGLTGSYPGINFSSNPTYSTVSGNVGIFYAGNTIGLNTSQNVLVYQNGVASNTLCDSNGNIGSTGDIYVHNNNMVVKWDSTNGCQIYDLHNNSNWLSQGGTTSGVVNTKNNTLDDGVGGAYFGNPIRIKGATDTIYSYNAYTNNGGIKMDSYGNLQFVTSTQNANGWAVISSTGQALLSIQNNNSTYGSSLAINGNSMYMNNLSNASFASVCIHWNNHAGNGGDNQLYVNASSRRYKKNIKNILFDTSPILDIQPVSFTYTNSNIDSWGLIAEDLHDLGLNCLVGYDQVGGLPGFIHYDKIGIFAVFEIKKLKNEINDLRAEFTKEIKKLHSTIASHTSTINSQQTQIQTLQDQIIQIKATLNIQ